MRCFARDCYSFCRFDVLSAGAAGVGEGGRSGSGEGSGGACAAQQQGQQLADAFLRSVLVDEPSPAGSRDPAACHAQEPGPRPATPQGRQRLLHGDSQLERPALAAPPQTAAPGDVANAGPARSPAAVAAAIWALHPCKQASLLEPPALLAIPGADERTAEVVCATCGQQVAEFGEAALGRKLGMLMALQLFCAAPAEASSADTAAVAKAASAAAPHADPFVGMASDRPASQGAPAGTCGAAEATPAFASQASPPRVFLAAGYEDGSVAVWQVGAAPGAPPVALRQLCSEPIMALAIDGAAAGGVAGSAEEQVVVFKLDLAARPARLSVRHSMEVHGKGRAGVGDVAVRPDRRLLATAGWDGRVRLFKYRSGRPLAVLKVGARQASCPGLAFA